MLVLQMSAPDASRMLALVDLVALRAFEVGVGAGGGTGGVEGVIGCEHDRWWWCGGGGGGCRCWALVVVVVGGG